ncbi:MULTISPECIES: hypothetical protein [Bacillus]|uniref:hypothetical protein n=1 Tax=Bacillus TaxID=1386 RepID=UPI000550FB6A|nr:hypothetical protein [Bacillus licheniformis]AKQ71761.1 hypothetical protein MUY_000629 [Bacillus licheniformis WX-02]MCP8974434.1 hypothetical protein [Bacillus licheniformis]
MKELKDFLSALEPKDWITILSIWVTLGIGIWNLFSNAKINRKTLFVNAITSERVKWMTLLKELLSEYLTLICTYERNKPRQGEQNLDFLKELLRLEYRIKLHLNYKGEKDKEIMFQIERANKDIIDYYNSIEAMDVIDENLHKRINVIIEKISTVSRQYLKEEWERVKEEAEKGNLKKEKFINRIKNKIKK